MTAMGKEDMIGLFIYPLPGNFLTLLLSLPDLFLFRALGYGILMAFEADVKVGHPGEGLGFEEAVACVTPRSLFDMFFMIERDRLLGFRTETQADEKKECEYPDAQSNEEKFHTLNHFVKIGLSGESPVFYGINRIMNGCFGRCKGIL